jgi:hypothetical protein
MSSRLPFSFSIKALKEFLKSSLAFLQTKKGEVFSKGPRSKPHHLEWLE